MTDDLRGIKRRHLVYYLDVFEQSTGKLLGHLVDITTKGIKLVSQVPIETERELEMRMSLPSGYFDRDELLFKGRSMWSSLDINPDFYDTGFEIPDLDAESREIISKLIEAIGFKN